MTPEKLKINLEKLRSQIARKPASYTPDHATKIIDSFDKYTNTSTINGLLAYGELLESYGWSFPIFISRETQRKFNLRWMKYHSLLILIKAFGFPMIVHLIRNSLSASPQNYKHMDFHKLIDVQTLDLFHSRKKEIFAYWRKSHLFQDKLHIISQIEKCYDQKLWIACVSTAFPLLDYLMRIYFNTRRFDRDINHLLSLLREAGISYNDLKPGYRAQLLAKEKGQIGHDSVLSNDLRLIGVALASFLAHAEIYYKYYRKDEPNPATDLNRHAVIHCAPATLNNKISAVKLLIFIDLTLELEPVMKILLKDD